MPPPPTASRTSPLTSTIEHPMRLGLTLIAMVVCAPALAQGARPDQAARGRVDLLDRIVAIVNKEVITQFELNEHIERVQKELQRRGAGVDRTEIEHQVLDRLIVEKV